MPTIAQQIASFAVSEASRQLDQTLLDRVAIHVLDTLAVGLAGFYAPSSGPVVRVVTGAAGKPEATVFGIGRLTSAWDAALANGTMAHALELDDDHRVAVLHPGAVVVPAAFAASEAAGASGHTFLRAVLFGYEVACRVGEVFRGSQFSHGVHPTALCGVFGAATAAAVAYELDHVALVHALGIAGTQASGLTEWRSDGSWIKRLHAGRAAQSGVLSACLAREGFTGPATIFEGPGGFFNAFTYGESVDEAALTRNLGVDFRALGTAIKPYPCCRFAHGAIDLALEAKRNGLESMRIRSIEVRLFRTDVLSYGREPANAVDAQFNVPYLVATGLLRGKIGLSDFTEEAIRDPQVLDLCRRISVVEDPKFTARYPHAYWTELAIDLKDGGKRRLASSCPRGDPDAAEYRSDPARFQREANEKVKAVLAECGFGNRAERLIAAVDGLHAMPDVTSVADLLGADVAQGPAVARA